MINTPSHLMTLEYHEKFKLWSPFWFRGMDFYTPPLPKPVCGAHEKDKFKHIMDLPLLPKSTLQYVWSYYGYT